MSDISTLNGYNLKDAQARGDINTIEGKIPSGASSSNKMATASDINAITEKIPSAASSSNKLVDTTAMNDAIGQAVSAAYKPAGTKTAAELVSGLLVAANKGNVYNITTAGTTTADFIEGAGKPIRIGDNVGVCEPTSGTFKFDLLSGFIAVDENPTAGSANPVSSGGTKTALDGKVDKVTGKGLSTNDYDNTAKGIVDNIQGNVIANTKLIKDTVGWSGKNILENLLESHTTNGVTMTHNADDSITLNNTATAWTFQNINYKGADVVSIPTGDYIISGGNSKVTFKIMVNGTSIFAKKVTQDEPFTIPANVTSSYMRIEFDNGTVFNNDTIYPMIRPADILDPTYEPYFGSTAFPRSEQAVLGAKNRLRNTASSTTDHGVEFVVNNDKDSDLYKTVTIKQGGQATADIYFPIFPHTAEPEIPQGNYIISGGFTPPQDLSIKFYLNERNAGNTGWGNQWADSMGSGVAYTRSNDYRYAYFIFIKNGTQITSDIVVKPMVRLATDPDPTYAPHAMTNKELSEIKAEALTGTISGATIGAESKYRSIGKVCWVYVRIFLTESLQQGGRITISNSNLPKNTLGSGFVFSNVFNQPGDIAWLDTDTKITFQHNGSNALSSGDVMQFSFCYPIA